MSARFDQDGFYYPDLYSTSQTRPVEFHGNYSTAPLLEATFSFESTFPQRGPVYQDTQPGQPPLWASPNEIWPMAKPMGSPGIESPKCTKVQLALDPRATTRRKAQKLPAGEALERRRQQNRAAQHAFRERSKRQMEEMRQELVQFVDFNRKMQDSVRILALRADDLRRDVEAILTVKIPSIYLGALVGEQKNRAAQHAFCECNKRRIEEMRQELVQFVDFNHKMQDSVRISVVRADDLRRDVEAILAVKMPSINLGALAGEQKLSSDSGTTSPEAESSLNV